MADMATSEISALEYGFGTLVTICLAVGGWLWTKLVAGVMQLRVDLQELDREHADYKLDAEKRFAKDDEVNSKFDKLFNAIDGIRRDISVISVSMASLATATATKMHKDNN